MRVLRDLSGNQPPIPMDLPYNGDLTVDSVTTRYKGSLVKFMDFNDIDDGCFLTFAGLQTAMENIFGILEEEQPTSGNYLPNDATYGVTRRKITPILPSTVIRAEYAQLDADGSTANYDTGATLSIGGIQHTVSITTADTMIGGWIYYLTGANQWYLHYIFDSETTYAELSTVAAYAVATGDAWLVIEAPNVRRIDFNATYTGIKSEIDDNVKADGIVGLDHWITAPGLPMTKLDRNQHDGLYIPNARFYHDFCLVSNQTVWNVFANGIKVS